MSPLVADGAANQNGAVALLVIVVLGKLVVALLVSWLVARTLLRLMIRIMRKWVRMYSEVTVAAHPLWVASAIA